MVPFFLCAVGGGNMGECAQLFCQRGARVRAVLAKEDSEVLMASWVENCRGSRFSTFKFR